MLRYQVPAMISPLVNKERGLLSVARICIGSSRPGGPNNSGSKLTSPISLQDTAPRQRGLFGLFHPPSGLLLHCLRLYQPYRGLLSCRNYKRSQLKLMSLNSLAPRFDCTNGPKAVCDTITLTVIARTMRASRCSR